MPPPAAADVLAGGRPAVRAWIAQRVASDVSKRPAESKSFDACLELAVAMYEQAGGRAIEPVLAEAGALLAPAQSRAKGATGRAREAARLGELFERAAANPVEARRLYEAALDLDAKDVVAREGLARLAEAERISVEKEVEIVRLKELEAEWAKHPRTRPPERSPFVGTASDNATAKP